VQDNLIELAQDTSEHLKGGFLFGEIIKTACNNDLNSKAKLQHR
jgi:hypothetical protein